MALRAAKNLGCDVPAEAIERAVEYIKRCQDTGSGGFRYRPARQRDGGLHRDEHPRPGDLRQGTSPLPGSDCAAALTSREPNLPTAGQQWFFYSIYYGSQAAFQLGGNYWTVFRPETARSAAANAERRGFWDGNSGDAAAGRPCLLHRDGHPRLDRRISLPAHLPTRRGTGREVNRTS